MTYRILGQGPPLFLIPGIASTYRVYALLLNRLAEHFQTILYDYPGEHPDDGARLGRITHDHLVNDLFGLVDRLNVGRAFLVGLSFGSTIALKPCIVSHGGSPGRPCRAVLPTGIFLGSRSDGHSAWAGSSRHRSLASRCGVRSWPITAVPSSPRSWTTAGTSTSSRTG